MHIDTWNDAFPDETGFNYVEPTAQNLPNVGGFSSYGGFEWSFYSGNRYTYFLLDFNYINSLGIYVTHRLIQTGKPDTVGSWQKINIIPL